MELLIALLLAAHGLFHLVGFGPAYRFWRGSADALPTSILGGNMELAEAGRKYLRYTWLALTVIFLGAGGLLAMGIGAWFPLTVLAVGASSILCVVGWPEAKWGVLANALMLGVLMGSIRMEWLSV